MHFPQAIKECNYCIGENPGFHRNGALFIFSGVVNKCVACVESTCTEGLRVSVCTMPLGLICLSLTFLVVCPSCTLEVLVKIKNECL